MADFNPKTIKGNIGGVYFTKTKEAVDPFNLTKYNPNTNQNIILFYLEDGVENNIVTVNFAPDDSSMPRKGWTSHDFPAIFRGYVDHTVNGEAIPRTFAQYLALVPTLITDLNLNNKNPLSFNATVIQQSGVNLLGSFNTLNDLINAHTPTESLHDNDAIAYVYENGQNGYYKVYFSSGSSTWYWGVYQGAISTSLSEVQYNLTGLQVQGGFRNPAPIVPLQDEQYRIIWQHLNELYAQYSVVIEGELGELEQEVIELNTAVVKTISKTDTNTIIIGLTRIDNDVNIQAVVNVSSNSYNLLKVVGSDGLEVNPEDIINEIIFEINNTNSALRQTIDDIVDGKITAHNTNSEAHQDIRDDIETAEQNANEYTDEEVAKKVDLTANQDIGGIKNFTDFLNYKGKQVLTTETGNIYSQQIADLQENKLNKIWADITEQTTTNLTDILVFNRGSNVYKTRIANLLQHITVVELFTVVAELPEIGVPNKIYLVPSSEPQTQNTLDEYIWVDNDWEKIGAVSVDLSNYFNKTEINALLGGKVDKVAGKGLSSNDYTNGDKQNVEKIPTIEQDIADLENDKVDKTDIVDNVTTNDGTKALSAKQGKVLYDILAIKVNISDIVDNLTSTDTHKPLSANQGKALKDYVDTTVGNIEDILDSILGV